MCASEKEIQDQAREYVPILWEMIISGDYGDAPRRTLRACLHRLALGEYGGLE